MIKSCCIEEQQPENFTICEEIGVSGAANYECYKTDTDITDTHRDTEKMFIILEAQYSFTKSLYDTNIYLHFKLIIQQRGFITSIINKPACGKKSSMIKRKQWNIIKKPLILTARKIKT